MNNYKIVKIKNKYFVEGKNNEYLYDLYAKRSPVEQIKQFSFLVLCLISVIGLAAIADWYSDGELENLGWEHLGLYQSFEEAIDAKLAHEAKYERETSEVFYL